MVGFSFDDFGTELGKITLLVIFRIFFLGETASYSFRDLKLDKSPYEEVNKANSFLQFLHSSLQTLSISTISFLASKHRFGNKDLIILKSCNYFRILKLSSQTFRIIEQHSRYLKLPIHLRPKLVQDTMDIIYSAQSSDCIVVGQNLYL